MIEIAGAIQASFSNLDALLPCVLRQLSADANTHTSSPQMPATVTGHDHIDPTEMIKTFSLSALFFLSLGLLFINAAQLPVA